MKDKLKLSTIILLIFFGLCNLHAQEAIPAAGGEAIGSGGSVCYTVGQVVYTTSIGTNGNSVAEGVQQPYEISVVSGIPVVKDISLNVSAYPNPTSNYLTIKVDALTLLSIRSLKYQMFDINGKLLQSKKLTSKETSISMEKYIPASYFVKIYENQNKIKTFKIVKN